MSTLEESISNMKVSETAWVHYIQKDPSLVDYGAVSSNLPDNTGEKFYLCTAIAYTNGYPHLGHAYEVIFISFSPSISVLTTNFF